MIKVILFDIDGTLVLTGGAGGRAMTRAFEELFAVPDAFRGIPMPGRTDSTPLRLRKSVVLPAPFGPTTATRSSAAT